MRKSKVTESQIVAILKEGETGMPVAELCRTASVRRRTTPAIGDFVDRHPSVKVLALAFLVMVGMALTAADFDQHVLKGTLMPRWRSRCWSKP